MIESVLTSRLILERFDPRWAATVASWVRTDDELFLLAPGTRPPMTAHKVLAWTSQRGMPFQYRGAMSAMPTGYAELNPMQRDARHLWIGHVLIDPAHRRQGLGRALTGVLVDRAFKQQWAQRLSLVVFPENVAAVGCYLQAGFQVRGEETQRFAGRARRHRLLRLEMTAEMFAEARSAASALGSATSARS